MRVQGVGVPPLSRRTYLIETPFLGNILDTNFQPNLGFPLSLTKGGGNYTNSRVLKSTKYIMFANKNRLYISQT